jgi:hypothetical protein
LAALSLLSMPVDFKGGAGRVHPHGLFQFWVPGGHVDLNWQDHHHNHSSHGAAQETKNQSPRDVAANRRVHRSPDQPAFSDMGAPAEKASGIAVSLMFALLRLLTVRLSGLRSSSRRLRGRCPAPESPPPRIAWCLST